MNIQDTPIQISKKDKILKEVLNNTEFTLDQLKGRKRTDDIVQVRQMFFYLCNKFTDLTWTNIGKTLNRTHANVIYAVDKRVPDLMRRKQDYKQKVLSLQNKIETILN